MVVEMVSRRTAIAVLLRFINKVAHRKFSLRVSCGLSPVALNSVRLAVTIVFSAAIVLVSHRGADFATGVTFMRCNSSGQLRCITGLAGSGVHRSDDPLGIIYGTIMFVAQLANGHPSAAGKSGLRIGGGNRPRLYPFFRWFIQLLFLLRISLAQCSHQFG
jgi:hypothetical protein